MMSKPLRAALAEEMHRIADRIYRPQSSPAWTPVLLGETDDFKRIFGYYWSERPAELRTEE